jgi:hypothetical protein
MINIIQNSKVGKKSIPQIMIERSYTGNGADLPEFEKIETELDAISKDPDRERYITMIDFNKIPDGTPDKPNIDQAYGIFSEALKKDDISDAMDYLSGSLERFVGRFERINDRGWYDSYRGVRGFFVHKDYCFASKGMEIRSFNINNISIVIDVGGYSNIRLTTLDGVDILSASLNGYRRYAEPNERFLNQVLGPLIKFYPEKAYNLLFASEHIHDSKARMAIVSKFREFGHGDYKFPSR